MKWIIGVFCAFVMMAGLVSAEQSADFNNLSDSDKMAHYETQLQQLQNLQAQENAKMAAFEHHSFAEVDSGAAATAATQVQGNHAKLRKLSSAMSAVKEDIMSKLREAQRESNWVKEVERIVVEYKKKVKNVKKNLAKIRKDIKELIKKKRQIRNAQIQEQLQDRLSDASGDLKMVQGKLASITAQQKAFESNRKKIARTISKIKSEMNHLQGKKPKPKRAIKKKAKKVIKKAKKVVKKAAKKVSKKDDKKKKSEDKDDEKKSFVESEDEIDSELAEFA